MTDTPAAAADDERPTSAKPLVDARAGAFRSVVDGIGTSAGGRRALVRFFGASPVDAGAAFVVIQHEARDRASALRAPLAQATHAAPVLQAGGGAVVSPIDVTTWAKSGLTPTSASQETAV